MRKIRQAISMKELHSTSQPKLEPVTDADMTAIFATMMPTSKLLLEKHVQWNRQYNK